MILLTRHKEENLFIKKKLLIENISSISEPITHVRHLSKKLQAEKRRARQQEETKNNVSNRNLILKCAMLEEKLEQSEVKCRRAETTMEALIQQLRHLRRSRSEEALQKEQKLY